MFVELTPTEFCDRFPDAHVAMVKLIRQVRDNDPEMFWEDPWTVNSFRFYIEASFEGVVVAERKQQPGPREPGLIWDGAAWFCSEDANTEQAELGWKLSKLSRGGIGGF